MPMTHKERLQTAWDFKEPDRVPFALGGLSEHALSRPRAGRIMELNNIHSDTMTALPGCEFGFMGFPTRYSEEVIEQVPGKYKRIRRVHDTTAGRFTAVTFHPEGLVDYHWEKRYVATLDDLRRLAETPMPRVEVEQGFDKRLKAAPPDRLAAHSLHHPLGYLVRNATMEDFYGWMITERATLHRFLTAATAQLIQGIELLFDRGASPYFIMGAYEMLIPPWLGHELFDEYVVAYDTAFYQVIRKHGGHVNHHCHGNCMDFLIKMADMGLNGINPLEPPPAGNVNLAEAKRLVGDRMLLVGNIPSERLVFLTPEEVRQMVKEAIQAAASGGGFFLSPTGGSGTYTDMSDAAMDHVLANCEAFLLAALEYGIYPQRR